MQRLCDGRPDEESAFLSDCPGNVARDGLTGAQKNAGEVGNVDGIREALGFQSNPLARLGKVFPRVNLESRGVRRHDQAVT